MPPQGSSHATGSRLSHKTSENALNQQQVCHLGRLKSTVWTEMGMLKERAILASSWASAVLAARNEFRCLSRTTSTSLLHFSAFCVASFCKNHQTK